MKSKNNQIIKKRLATVCCKSFFFDLIFSVDFVGVRVVVVGRGFVVGRRIVVGRIRAVFKGVQFHFVEVEPVNLVLKGDCYEVDDRDNPPAAEDKKNDGKNRADRIFFHDAFRKAIKIRGDCPKEIEKELDPSAEPFV